MIDYTCPNCGQQYSLDEEWRGREARCQKCNQVITIPGPAPGGAAAAAAYPPSVFGGVGGPQPITPRMAQSLRATRPWVLFLSILGFIGCGLIVVFGVIVAAGRGPTPYQRGGVGVPAFMGVIYLVVGVIYFVPAYYLLKYSGGIRQFLLSGTASDMETALDSQKSFWRFVGILTAVVLCIYLILLVVAAVFFAVSLR